MFFIENSFRYNPDFYKIDALKLIKAPGNDQIQTLISSDTLVLNLTADASINEIHFA
jgi:hypothetical protein